MASLMQTSNWQVRSWVSATRQRRHDRLSILEPAEWFRALLYRPSSAARLPWVIHRASKGDWAPIVEGILGQARDADSDLSFGLLLSITCSEDVPFVREDEVEAATRDTFLGDWRLRQQQTACKVWPHAVVPANYREP